MLGYLLSPVLQIEDTNGLPLVDGKVYVYETNTSNLATIYSNYEGTLNTNPAILDLAGHTTIIANDDKMYDITVKDKDDNLLFSAKDVAVGGEGGSAIVTDITVQAGNNGIAVGQSVVSGVKTFKVSADYNFLASKSDLANKQDKLSAGPNIDITSNVVSSKDWQNEIDAAVSAVATGFIPYSATNIPAGSSVSVYGDNMLLVGKNITGIAYGNLAVGENIYKTGPNGLLAGSSINGSQNDIVVGNGVSAGNNALVLGDSISSLGFSIIIGGPSITGQYGESTIVAGNNNLTGMGNNNVVLGYANTTTSGNDNVIIGRGNSTTGSENIVIGIDNSSNSGTIFGGIYNQVNNFGYIYGGSYNTATNAAAVLNGDGCYASGTGSVAQGKYTSAYGDYSHAEGVYTLASGDASHAEGNGTSALEIWSHAEGDHCIAYGWHSHAEGSNTSAYGSYSHALGSYTFAQGGGSLVAGDHTSAIGINQIVIGKYNNPNYTDILQIGCGEPNNNLNAFELRDDKSMYYYYEGNMVRLEPFRRYIPGDNFLLNGSTDLVIVDYSGESDSFQILGNDSEIAMIWDDNGRGGTVYVDGSSTPLYVNTTRVKLKDIDIYDRARIEIFGMGIGYYIPHWVYTIFRDYSYLHVYAEQVYDDIIS